MKRGVCFLIISVAILGLLIPLALAQVPSPAGGRYFDLEKRYVFAGTKNDKVAGAEFKTVTVEAWICPTSLPWPSEERIIFDGGGFELLMVNTGYSFRVCSRKVMPGGGLSTGVFTFTKPGQIADLNKWHHISASYDNSSRIPRISFDGEIFSLNSEHLGDLRSFSHPVSIGGWKEPRYFDGFIDEVRISNVIRYEEDIFDPPKQRFEVDENTVALWHFDEAEDATRFEDASGNGISLFLSEDGQISVKPIGKMSSTWGEIKLQ